jgi:predicted  nucleic acid-binding Zn-ribbon protein
LISRISPVLKRKSSAQSPSKDISADSYVLDPATFGTPEMVTRQMTKEDLENMSSCSVDSNLISSEGNSARIEDGNQNTRFKELEADFQQMQEEKVQLDKQLTKAREEARMLSDLIKDMEHKWTEVAKDYEKQVSER